MKKIILVGAGGHFNSMVDTIENNNEYEIYGYTNPFKVEECIYNYLGTDDMLQQLYSDGIKHIAIAIGYMGHANIRNKIYDYIKQIGFNIPTIIDKSAVIANTVKIGEGTYVGKGCVLNSYVAIGEMCIINTGAIIEHNCIIGDFSHVAGGSVICGSTIVGKAVFVGANTTLIEGLTIGNSCIIGAGSVVINDIEDGKNIVGNPGRIINE